MARNGKDLTGFRVRGVPADLAAPYGAVRPASGGPAIDRALQIYLPEVYPIPAATEFNTLVTKATVGVETGTDIGLTVQVPPNNVGVLRGVAIYISDMLASTNVTFNVLFNGAVAAGYSNLLMFPRVSPYVSNTFDAFVRIPNGQKITVTFNNVDGGTYTVGAAVSGWWWPKALGDQWLRSGGVDV